MKVYNQTLIAPMVTSLLFLAVFSLAMGHRVREIAGVPFQEFMVAGLIMMTMAQNAFANTSSSLTMGKVLGTMIDLLLPPLSARDITLAMILGGVTRGICAGIAVTIAASFFVKLQVHDAGLMLLYILLSCTMLAALGMVTGIISDSFDQTAAITSYIITPLTFLSGTFYSVTQLPAFWQTVNQFNPFFYMVDGFRYSMTGHSDGSLTTGLIVLCATNLLLCTVTYVMLKKGVRIKS